MSEVVLSTLVNSLNLLIIPLESPMSANIPESLNEDIAFIISSELSIKSFDDTWSTSFVILADSEPLIPTEPRLIILLNMEPICWVLL